jgi:hypothetical protein
MESDGLLGVTAIDISVAPPVIVSVIGMVSGELLSVGSVITKAPLWLPVDNPVKFTETFTVPFAQDVVGVTESHVWFTDAVNGVQVGALSMTVTDCAAGALPPLVPEKAREVTPFSVLAVYCEVLAVTVRVALLLVALPAELVTTTENVAPVLAVVSTGVV